MSETIHIGQLNRLVEVFKYETQTTTTSERERVEVSLGKKFVYREEVSSSDDENGKLITLSVARFIMRFDLEVLKNGNEYFIRDIDGNFHVNNVSLAGVGRNKFIELKCSKSDG